MNKKYILIAVVILVLLFLYFSQKKSVSELIDANLSNNAQSNANKAQANIAPTGDSNEDEYNIAREQYRALSGNYPPQNWTLEQINLWVTEWKQMAAYLEKYSQNMSAMQLTEKAKANIANCNTVTDAKLLYESSLAELATYQEKMAIYSELIQVCDQYHIDASDLGISTVSTSTKSQINNALTRAKSLGDVKTRYEQLADMCKTAGVSVSQYLSGKKWFELSLVELDAAIGTVSTLYESSIATLAKAKATQIAKNINPLIDGNYKGTDLMSFRDRPYENRWALDPQIFQDVVAFCAQSADHLRAFKTAFASIGIKYPTYRCQAERYWTVETSLSMLICDGINHSGGATHLTARDNWSQIQQLVDNKLAPLV